MDVISSAVGAFTEAYSLALFIYEVVQDIKEYDSDKDTIRQKLEHEIFFLEAFNKFFLDQESGGLIYDPNLPATYPLRVTNILEHLRESLSAYSKLALKYYPPYQRLILGDDAQRTLGDLSLSGGKEKDFDKTGFRAKIKNLSLRAWDWPLFDKGRLLEVVTQFKEWSEKLKEIMQFSMLFAVRFKDVTALEEFQKSDTAKKTGLEYVAQRQILNRSKTIKEAQPLEGKLVETSSSVQGSTTQLMRLITEKEPYGKPIAVEYKGYGLPPTTNEEMRQNLLKVKTNIRTLATVLLNSAFVEDQSSAESSSAPVLHTFQCIGYIDEPEKNRMAFVFQLPPVAVGLGDLQTLHAFIEELDSRKRPANYLPLEQRFVLAHNLCMTILNLHGSGWVHKSIRSTNMILLPKDSAEFSFDEKPAPPSKVVPYVTGFEFSRLALAATEVGFDFDIDRNLYRHPSRQGHPTESFNKLHDLYALGVVLLEIGVWRTVTSRLKPGFEQAKKFGKVPSPEYVRQSLIKIAKEELPKEMGTQYTKAVVTCLSGDFAVGKGDPQLKELGLAFREQVIEVIANGLKL